MDREGEEDEVVERGGEGERRGGEGELRDGEGGRCDAEEVVDRINGE